MLAHIWDTPIHSPRIDRALGELGHVVEANGHSWVFVYREAQGLRAAALDRLASIFRSRTATADLDKLMNGAIVGAATLAVALVLAILMGVRMARSIRTITTAAEAIERLEFDQPMHKRLAAARDRRCRAQPRQGAHRAALVRPLRCRSAWCAA